MLLAVPSEAFASFLSSILGGEVYAQTDQTPASPDGNNSQTMALLEANVSSASIFQDKPATSNGSAGKSADKTSPIDPNEDVNIVSDNALLPSTGLTGSADNQEIIDSSAEDTSVYVVRKGDTVSTIASMFDVSVNTILAANDIKKGEKLVEGDVLLILPISGLEHTVTKGQTLKGIANLYKVDITDIALFNGLSEDSTLSVGDKLIVPGGDMADEGGDKPASNLSSAPTRDKNYYVSHPLVNLVGYFINPLPTGHKTQGLHGPGNRGIDIGAPTGTPIYASASGTVLITKTGCKVGGRTCGGGYGNMAIIQHPNGTKTLYGHMSKVATFTGAHVTQGQVIGYVGSTGRSTGPHVHFEVFNARNPGADWSWANR